MRYNASSTDELVVLLEIDQVASLSSTCLNYKIRSIELDGLQGPF